MGVQINGDTGNVIATKGTYSGNVTIGGTLTYEDVTNIDAVGLITARSGIEIGARPGVAASISVDGNAIFSGITTVGSKIDVTNDTHGNLNAVLARGSDPSFQLQSRNNQHSNSPQTGIATFGAFYSDNEVVTLNFMRGTGSSGAGSLGITQAGTETLRIDSSGRVLIGHSSAVHSTSLQVLGATGNTSSISLSRFSNSAASPLVVFNKSRNATVGSNTVVQDDDTVGIIRWEAADGTDYSQVADIQGQIDGSPGDNDTPGRLVFSTTSDGASTTTERLRITAGGDVIVNDTTAEGNVHPDTKFHVKGGITFRELTSASEGALPAITQWSSSGTGQDLVIGARSNNGALLFYTGNTGTDGDWGDSSSAERLRIASSGKITATLGSANSDGFDIQGHASQGRSTLNLIAGNATSNATTSMRLTRSNGNQPIQIFIEHDENHGNIMNGVVGGMIKFHVNESGSSLVRNVMTDTGHFVNTRGTSGRIAFGTNAGVLYSGFGRYDGAAQDVGISHFATTNAGTTFVEHFRMEHNGTLKGTDTSIGSLSDSRLKKNIADYSYDISKFKQFKPKTFDWINPEVHGDKSNVKGFIAQDIETVDGDWVEDSWIKESDPDFSLVSDTTTTNGAGETVGVSKVSKFGYKDAMYISVIQQLISRIETLESS